MAYALVANTTNFHASGGATNTSSAITTTGATLLIVVVADDLTRTTTLTDSKGNVFTSRALNTAGVNVRVQVYECLNPIVGTGHTFTGTHSGSQFSYFAIVAMAFTGNKTTAPFDQSTSAVTSSGTSLASGSITPSVNNALVIAALGCDILTGPTAGLTLVDYIAAAGGQSWGLCVQYALQTSAVPVNPTWTWTTSTDTTAVVTSWKSSVTGQLLRASSM
ncbi:MAG: hypothetical protein JWM95_759, partial [Gemmatimonadetes bacterium]|nr:hypothetical protein [Gemmatimonadota bacterium]